MRTVSLIAWLFIGLMISSCNDDDVMMSVSPSMSTSLTDYINSNGIDLVRDSLIACALSANNGFLGNSENPISILYYPEGEVSDVSYFETDELTDNPEDLDQYNYKNLSDEPIFNGYLRRFLRPSVNKNIWCRVTYVKNGKIHISNAIRIKYNDLPTENNKELLNIDRSEALSPSFSWEEGRIANNAIYFHVILDENGDLISGTYTFNRFFKFYDLTNVVLNIRDVTPAPSLIPNADYQFVLMGVSLDNWVNLLINEPFSTQ